MKMRINRKRDMIKAFIKASILLFVLVFVSGSLFAQGVTAGFTYDQNCKEFQFASTSISTGGGISSYDWDFGDGGGSTLEDPAYTYLGTGNYTVTLTVTHDDLVTTDMHQETVSIVEPTAAFDYDQTCALFEFADLSTPDDGTITNWDWDFGDLLGTSSQQNPIYTYPDEGDFIVKLKVTHESGCQDSITQDVSYYLPEVAFSIASNCETFIFTDLSSTQTGTITDRLWDFGDGTGTSTAQNPNYTYAIPGEYTVSLTVTTSIGCEVTVDSTISFYNPTAAFTFDNICGDFEFENESTVTDGELTYFWVFDDGFTSTDENPTHSYLGGGDYEVSLTVTHESGCTDTYMEMVSFYFPIAQFTHDVACVGTETCFYDESIPNSDSISTWIWNFGNGNSSSSQNPCIVYTSPGDYIVTLVVVNSDGCFSEPAIVTLNIDYPPDAEFIANPACFMDTTSFINITDTHDIEIASWSWDFGDLASGINNTSNLFEPTHLFTTEGPFDVILDVENINGCVSSFVETIMVDSLPDAEFSMPDTVAVGVEFTITDLTIAYGSPILTRFWDFGDGQTAINPNPVIHTYDNPGTYEVCLYVTNFSGCSDSICYTITISELPFADFTYDSDITLITNFFDDSNPDTTIVGWFWDFGDLTVTSDTVSGTPTPTYTYPEEGYYNVFLEVTDSYGGKSDTIKTIYVGNALVADYYHLDVCFGDTTVFYDISYSPLSLDINSYYWNFDDGSDTTYTIQSDSIIHYYDTAGVYNVAFAISGFLGEIPITDTMTYEVTVFHQPIARIDSNNLIVCLTNYVNFKDSSIVLDNDSITGWFWEFGDGEWDTIQNPSHKYDSINEYQAILTVNTSHYCSDTDTVIARVTDSPDIDFTVVHACANAATSFVPDETDIEITEWYWTFGDQYTSGVDTSTQSHPEWWYSRVGEYTVTMEASSFGCVTTQEQTFLVYPIPYADFAVTPDFGDVQGRTKFTNTSIYATHYEWDFGNGNTSTVVNPIEVYEKDSTYIITLASINEYICTDTATFVLEVFFKELNFPTAFSPNNPNTEISLFQPKGVNLATYLVQVFDQRGNLLWESDKLDGAGSPVEGWDGYSNGLLMPQGVYIWKAQGVFRDGTNWKGSELQSGEPQPHGTMTLIR